MTNRIFHFMPRLAVATAALVIASAAAAAETPVRKRLPTETDAAIQTLLDWQRNLDGATEAHVVELLGEPDQRVEMPRNEASGEPMHTLKYRLSRHSALSVVVHQGEVAAVTITLVPSANESGPVDH